MFDKLDIKPEKENSVLLAGISYFGNLFLPFLAPIIIYLSSKDDKYVKFHSVQSFCILLFVHAPIASIFMILLMMQLIEENMMFIFIFLYAFVVLIINLIFLVIGILAILGKTIRAPYPFITDLAYKITK